MPTTVTLRPFRDYDEKDVINLFAWSGVIPVNKGTIVKVQGSGLYPGLESVETLGNMGDFNPGGIVALRYGTAPKVSQASSGDRPLGILLFDVKEVDENGYQLKYKPSKAAEMEIALSGQTVPILTRGLVQYSGVLGAPVAGGSAYVGLNGELSATGNANANVVGKFLGITGVDGSVLVLLNF